MGRVTRLEKKLDKFLYNNSGYKYNNFSDNYFKGVKFNNCIRSIDNIVILGNVNLSEIMELNNEFTNAIVHTNLVEVSYQQKFGSFGYRYLINYTSYEPVKRKAINKDGTAIEVEKRVEMGTFTLMFLNNCKDNGSNVNRTVEFKVDFNPNKFIYNSPVMMFLSYLLHLSKSCKITSADFTMDIPNVSSKDLVVDRYQKSDLKFQDSGFGDTYCATWNIGKTGSKNDIIVYQKNAEILAKKEQKYYGNDYLEYASPMCRVEEKIPFSDLDFKKFINEPPFHNPDTLVGVLDIGKKYIKNGRDYIFSNDSYLVDKDGNEIDISIRCELYAIKNGFVKLDDFPRRKKERLKKLILTSSSTVTVNFSYTEFIPILYNICATIYKLTEITDSEEKYNDIVGI